LVKHTASRSRKPGNDRSHYREQAGKRQTRGKKMKKVLLMMAVMLLVFPCVPVAVLADSSTDTGTFRIDNYTITLTPQPDGSVNISYYQQWTCLSGNMPWITVGLTNSAYTITGSDDNVKNIRDDSGSGWYGVYVGLDKTYYANQSAAVSFTVNQKNLLNRTTNSWGINFAAGYYDNIPITKMAIILVSPIPPSEYSYSITPTNIVGDTMTWEKTNLPVGYQFTVSVSSNDGSFLLASVAPSNTGFIVFLAVAVILLILGFAISSAVKRNKNRAAYGSPEVSPIAHKKYFGSQDSLEEQKKKLQENEDKVNEYILSEKDKIPEDEKNKQINDYAAAHNLFMSGNNYIDDYGNSYTNNMLWMFIMMNAMQSRNEAINRANPTWPGSSGFHNTPPPPFIHTPSCACACVACACACACACAGGHAAGCTVKLKNFKTGNSND
jgi:uncharacterized membrane protein